VSRSTSPKRRRKQQEHNPKAMCPVAGKVRHASRKKALTVLNKIRGTGVRGVKRPVTMPEDVYKCRACGDWHLTKLAQP
jgi:hypothetical protein